ncbi:sigma-54-dependent Fis family transcriptional regulator [bacterium]|nr:MAG: sigma-54-dependent Fis family transcriptional regulator [bacterium]
MKHKVLIIEDDEIMRVTIEDSLNAQGYITQAYEQGMDGVRAFQKEDFSLVITDVRLPDMKGLDVLKKAKEINTEIPVIIMTAFGTIKDAVEAIKLGAFDYITKPFSLEEFILTAQRAFELKELRDENIRLRKDLNECYSYPNVIGESAEMVKIYNLIEKISQTDSTVLILGENGTGKELIASTIHYQSNRRNGPLIRIHCAAFPENLVESELFGYEKGAFTGAAQRKPGRFERADKGTIFLDEIGELPHSVQIKLLRVLQDGSFERLGGTETLNVDVRIITATNRNLEEDIKSGRFREDLFYRLNVIPLHMPALRERREDIPLLIDYFLGIYNCRFGKRMKISSDAIKVLMDYNYPGNVRELGNILERCVTLSANTTITQNDLPPHIAKNLANKSSMNTLTEIAAEAEKIHIMRILKSTKGNKTKAAEILGISRKTLWEKMNTYNVEYLS